MKRTTLSTFAMLLPLLSFAVGSITDYDSYAEYKAAERAEAMLPFIVIGYIVAVILAIVLTRLIFSIPKFLKYQRTQTQLLLIIAGNTSDKQRTDYPRKSLNDLVKANGLGEELQLLREDLV